MNAPTQSGAPRDAARYDDLLMRVGHLTRSLHESLRELGLDKDIERLARDDIANTRERLMYVARMTEQAAQRVLNATDAAAPLQEQIEQGATELLHAWCCQPAGAAAALSNPVPADLQTRTIAYLEQTRATAASTRAHLIDIMMAQDFQDLTGQVITKVAQLGHSLESQLVQLLIDHAPADGRREPGSGLLNGPQIRPEGKLDVVAGQEQVDDLLESLGF